MKELTTKLFVFDKFSIYELLIYIIYIYFLVFIFINLKPNIYNLFCLFIYVLVTTKLILDKCYNNLEIYTKNLLIVIYAVNCCAIYYFINFYKKIIFKSKFLTFIVIMLPFIYFFSMRMYQLIFNCHRSYVVDLIHDKPLYVKNNY